jgi:hypothetical protein
VHNDRKLKCIFVDHVLRGLKMLQWYTINYFKTLTSNVCLVTKNWLLFMNYILVKWPKYYDELRLKTTFCVTLIAVLCVVKQHNNIHADILVFWTVHKTYYAITYFYLPIFLSHAQQDTPFCVNSSGSHVWSKKQLPSVQLVLTAQTDVWFSHL